MDATDTTLGIVVERNVMIPMRDGVQLAADIFRPLGAGPWPVLVTRCPYNKALPFEGQEERRLFLELNLDAWRVIQAGYVIVFQDTRGRFASEGAFTPFADERNDGADTIVWAEGQPWSSGHVGMFGISYQAITQWQAALAQPTALKAIAPGQSPGVGWYPYQGGAFWLSVTAGWTAQQGLPGDLQRQIAQGRATQAELTAVEQGAGDLALLFGHVPLREVPLFGDQAPYYTDWLAHPDYDAYWQQFGGDEVYEQIMVPAFILAGWYDYFLIRDLAAYQGMRAHGGSEPARRHTRLLIGPWTHGNFWAYYEDRPDLRVANQRVIDLTGRQLRWFDHWLKGADNGVDTEKPVRIFVLGTNIWRDENDWPLPDTQYRPYYLHGALGGDAQAGLLSNEVPAEQAPDTYRYDPHDPVPSLAPTITPTGFTLRWDQRAVEDRADVLCYTSAALDRPLEVTGPVHMVLYAASSALDTDFTGKLVDVHPDGHAELLTDGILRARYRLSLSTPTLLEPGAVYELHIDLGATANVFLAGHRIRVEVASSNFPRFDRNTNTGGSIAGESAADFVTATNRIYHDSAHPSCVVLPIIERD